MGNISTFNNIANRARQPADVEKSALSH